MNPEPAHGNVVLDKHKANEARRVLVAFGRCVLDRYPGYSAAFLAQHPESNSAYKAANGLLTSECLDRGTLEVPVVLLRGVLFEAMYARRGSQKLTSASATVAPVEYLFQPPVSAAAAQDEFGAALDYADCAVRASPMSVDAVLGATPGSPLEADAFDAMMPALAGCLTRDVAIKFTKVALRGLLAEAAYKLANPALVTVKIR